MPRFSPRPRIIGQTIVVDGGQIIPESPKPTRRSASEIAAWMSGYGTKQTMILRRPLMIDCVAKRH
jgi:hypothetical protein